MRASVVVELDLVAEHAARVVLALEAVAMDALLFQRGDYEEVHLGPLFVEPDIPRRGPAPPDDSSVIGRRIGMPLLVNWGPMLAAILALGARVV